MSGFAVLLDTSLPLERRSVFQHFLRLTVGFKKLTLPPEIVSERHCHAAKLDSSSSLHKGIVRDEGTQSWALAAGTIVKIVNNEGASFNLEVLLKDYLEYGQEALDYYDGSFAIIIYDGRDESLSIISDPTGLFSVFYAVKGSQIFISSSALAVAGQVEATLDPLGVDCFLRAGIFFGETTLWEDVKRLLPATVLKFKGERLQSSEYWAPIIDRTIADLSFDDALEQAFESLLYTFEFALGYESKIWADLTGGFDTRLATLILSKTNVPYITNCVGPDNHPDVVISSKICQEMGWEYKHITMPENWKELQRDWLEIALNKGDANLEVSQLARVLWAQQEKATISQVSITGLGGELWRGAYWRQELFNIGRTQIVDFDRFIDFRVFLSPLPEFALRKNLKDQVHQGLKRQFKDITAPYADQHNTTQLDRILIYTYTNHEGAYLSAAAGIQRYVHPLCFKLPTIFALSLDNKWKHPISQRLVRNLFEKESPHLASFATTDGGPAVSMRLTNVYKFWPLWRSVINRVTGKFSRKYLGQPLKIWPEPKYPHYPLPDWRRGWLDFVLQRKLLLPAEMISGNIYNARSLKLLVSQAELGNFEYSDFLERVVTVEMAVRASGTKS